MTIKQMHYDYKKKLNKTDSQQYINLQIPEIDWVLNEAIELFVKMVAKPRTRSYLGFETSQRTIDDIRTLVVRPESDPNASIITITNNVVTLPQNYWYFTKGTVYSSKNSCTNVKMTFQPRQHDDDFEKSVFDKSNFEWRHVNGVFFENGIKLFDDGTFINNIFHLVYIKRHPYVHNAEDFRNGSYIIPGGATLTGLQDCILPEGTHSEIVDLAVLITTGEIQSPNYQIMQNKLKLNGLN